VYVTDVPAQTGFADAVMVTLTGNAGLTVIVITFEVAGFPVGQTAFEVSTQEITCPLRGTKA
jgi:hypothetical protein